MYISWAPCQVEGSQSIVLGSNVYILGALSGGKVLAYINGFLCIILGICQVRRSQRIVIVSYVYILCPLSGGKVPEYSTAVLCLYPRPNARWDGPRV